MSKELSAFHPVSGFEGIYTAQKGMLRCTAVRLQNDGVCLYSPVQGLGNIARESLFPIGKVTHLLAPNHYHHKGLSEYHSVFPKAALCCTSAAMPRLSKQTNLSFDNLEDAEIRLPDNAAFLEPQGLKTGEIWIQMSVADKVLWIVTDAFCGAKGPIGMNVQKPELLRTFPRFGVKDRNEYLEWISGQLEATKPTTIAPCHGSLVSGSDVGSAVLGLVENL